MSLPDAIGAYVLPGLTVALEGFGHLVPFAAAHEIIRQRIRRLTVCRMSCDLMVDQLLAAGCVEKLISAFVGNSSAGSLHELRRRMERGVAGGLTLEEYSHGGMIGRYVAGASRAPFHPIRSYRGSDLVALNPNIKVTTDPFSGESVYVVAPLNPDVSIIHAQRADRAGNIQAWGILGIQQDVAFAGRRVLVTVEQVVDDEVIRSDPNRTIVPSHVVDAVIECPGGAFPSSVQGFYERDDDFFRAWTGISRDPVRLRQWISDFILTPGGGRGR